MEQFRHFATEHPLGASRTEVLGPKSLQKRLEQPFVQ